MKDLSPIEESVLARFHSHREQIERVCLAAYGLKVEFRIAGESASHEDLLALAHVNGDENISADTSSPEADVAETASVTKEKKVVRRNLQSTTTSSSGASFKKKRRDWSPCHPAILEAVQTIGTCSNANLRKQLETLDNIPKELTVGTRLNSVINVMVRNGLLVKENGQISVPGEANVEGDPPVPNPFIRDDDPEGPEVLIENPNPGEPVDRDIEPEEIDDEAGDTNSFENATEDDQEEMVTNACRAAGHGGKYFSAADVSRTISTLNYDGSPSQQPDSSMILGFMKTWEFSELTDSEPEGDENTNRFQWKEDDRPLGSPLIVEEVKGPTTIYVLRQEEIESACATRCPCTVAELKQYCAQNELLTPGYIDDILSTSIETLIQKGILCRRMDKIEVRE